MDIKIKNGQELSVKDFESILDLDLKVFGNEILTNQGMAVKRFLKFRDSIIAAYTDNTLMGFISFFSVVPSVYKRAVAEEVYIDDDLQLEELTPLSKTKENDIFLFDHVVDEPFREHGLSTILLESVRDFLKQKQQEGFGINRIFGFAVTSKGCQILSGYGGKAIWARDEITFIELDKERFLGIL